MGLLVLKPLDDIKYMYRAGAKNKGEVPWSKLDTVLFWELFYIATHNEFHLSESFLNIELLEKAKVTANPQISKIELNKVDATCNNRLEDS